MSSSRATPRFSNRLRSPCRSASKAASQLIKKTGDALEAIVQRATLLLITDAYSAGQRIGPIVIDRQSRCEILRARWMLRVVPLEARIRLGNGECGSG